MAHQAFIALGGNLGDVPATFQQALARLAERGASIEHVSRLYRTAALVPSGASAGPDYWNAVALVATELAPLELLRLCLALESEAGRVRRARWEARPLDLDLLIYDDVVMNETELELPHPRLAERAFVLLPLADVAPELRVPGHDATVRELMLRLRAPAPLEVRAFMAGPA